MSFLRGWRLEESLRKGVITAIGKSYRKRCPILRKISGKKRKMTCVKALKYHPPIWLKHI